MRVSAKADYALRALIEIANRDDGRPVSAEELGRLQEIPHGFLQAILADMRRAGIVVSQRGQSGGWRLAAKPADVSVADVIRAVDGPLVSVYGLRPEAVSYNESAEILQHVWIAARSSLREVFENVTIESLAGRALPDAVEAAPSTRTPGSRTDPPLRSPCVHLSRLVDLRSIGGMARRKLIWHIGLAQAPRP